MKLLLDEMYGAGLAEALRGSGVEVTTVAELRLTGAADPQVFATAIALEHAVLTENVGDFVRLATDHGMAGGHHHGLLIALSSRFSRRPSGRGSLVAATLAVAHEQLTDRIVYLTALQGQESD